MIAIRSSRPFERNALDVTARHRRCVLRRRDAFHEREPELVLWSTFVVHHHQKTGIDDAATMSLFAGADLARETTLC
jgi:hypothetical protein